MMESTTEASNVTQKTRELCEAIVSQPEFQTICQRVDAFMSNEEAKAQYQQVSEKGGALQMKQQQGQELSEEEIADFERDRDALLANPVARNFLDSQQEIQKVRESVNKYVSKTFELGRLPEEADLQCGSCGSGCCC